MYPPAPDSRPIALTVAGSDSGGGAGIQADLATMAAHETYGTSVITAVTAQHTRGVERAFPLPIEEVTAQLEAVRDDFEIGAAKTGMLATTEIVETLASKARTFEYPLVVDPVMVATSGDRLLEPAAERAYESLIGAATVVTPNADEAAVLTGVTVDDEASARAAGDRLLEFGADAALLKGGHVPGETVRDVLVTDTETITLEHPRVETDATHGSGCALSAAITARLAHGDELRTAVEESVDFLARAVRYYSDVGEGPGAVNHTVGIRNDVSKAPTAEAVSELVERVRTEDFSPQEGVDVVAVGGTTPYAETVDDVAIAENVALDSDTTPAADGCVRFGTESDLTDVVLAARASDPGVRFGISIQFTGDVERALEALEWSVARIDRESIAAIAGSGVLTGDSGGKFELCTDEIPSVFVLESENRDWDATIVVVGTREAVLERGRTVCERVG